MSLFKQKQTAYRGFYPPPKRHKGLVFRPINAFKNKRELNKYLRHSHDGAQIAHSMYYRVYKRRYQNQNKYWLYVCDTKNKFRHGGVRRRSETGEGKTSRSTYVKRSKRGTGTKVSRRVGRVY